MAPITTVEHVVLFKVKEGIDPSKVDEWISNLRALISIDVVSHLAAVPILRSRSSSASHFTHLLHSRYKTKPDLDAYSAHPVHQAVVKEFVPIIDDIMAVDWVADLESGPVVLSPGSAARLTLAKLKEGAGEEGKGEIMAVLGETRKTFPGIEQVSYGENFSPVRARGFTVGFISVFPGLEELDALDAKGQMLEAQEEDVKLLLDSVIVVDFVVPPASAIL